MKFKTFLEADPNDPNSELNQRPKTMPGNNQPTNPAPPMEQPPENTEQPQEPEKPQVPDVEVPTMNVWDVLNKFIKNRKNK